MHRASRRHLSTGACLQLGRSHAARYGTGYRVSQNIFARLCLLLLSSARLGIGWVFGLRPRTKWSPKQFRPRHLLDLKKLLTEKSLPAKRETGSVTRQPARPLRDLRGIGQERLFERRAVGDRRIGRRHAHDRAVQILESLLRNPRRKLAADAAGERVLVQQQHLRRLAHAGQHRLFIERRQRPQIHDLDRNAFLLERLGRFARHVHHRAVGDDRKIAALAHHGAPCRSARCSRPRAGLL